MSLEELPSAAQTLLTKIKANCGTMGIISQQQPHTPREADHNARVSEKAAANALVDEQKLYALGRQSGKLHAVAETGALDAFLPQGVSRSQAVALLQVKTPQTAALVAALDANFSYSTRRATQQVPQYVVDNVCRSVDPLALEPVAPPPPRTPPVEGYVPRPGNQR